MNKQTVYTALGISRQAVAAYWSRRSRWMELLDAAEAELRVHRKSHPGLGLQKAWYLIKPEGVSRERFCYEMTWRGYALDIKRSYIRVTRSGSYRFPNLIKGLIVNGINQVWQSDTTYYRIGEVYYYLTFIIDVYSRRIVGAHASTHLRAEAYVVALKDAINSRKVGELSGLILHSDGGAQYRSKRFTEVLRQHGISSSMCDVALDNAYAERLNGVIKQEYIDHWQPQDFTELTRQLKRAVSNYNGKRGHGQLPTKTNPDAFIAGWLGAVPCYQYALLIKDGQGPNTDLRPEVASELSDPGMYVGVDDTRILPSSVKVLQKTKEMLCLRA